MHPHSPIQRDASSDKSTAISQIDGCRCHSPDTPPRWSMLTSPASTHSLHRRTRPIPHSVGTSPVQPPNRACGPCMAPAFTIHPLTCRKVQRQLAVLLPISPPPQGDPEAEIGSSTASSGSNNNG